MPLRSFIANVTVYVTPLATPPLTRTRAAIVQSARSGAVCWPTSISLLPRKTRHVMPIDVPVGFVAQ